jgi:hypothetical protein
MSRESQELEVSAQRIHTESVDSQNLHRQLELSRAREQDINVYGQSILVACWQIYWRYCPVW